MIDRRTVLVSAAATLTLTAIGRAGAATQVAGVYRRGIGDATVTALLDGYIPLDPGMLAGSDPETNARLLAEAFLANGPVETSINAYLVETGGRTVMIDGGAASAFGPTAGKLLESVRAAGIDPAAVDTFFTTHLHPDHIGILTSDGRPTFAGAELVMHADEHAFWTNTANFEGKDEQTQAFAGAAQAAIAPYADRIVLIEDGVSIAPGLTAMHLPGHTPGHTGLMLDQGGAQLLIWGDIVHVGPVQFARPAFTIPFDVDQPMAAATRARVLDMVATDRLEIAGSHIDFPSMGHVETAAEGYHFVPGRWDHNL